MTIKRCMVALQPGHKIWYQNISPGNGIIQKCGNRSNRIVSNVNLIGQ